eukprot:s4159_g3.t1
MADCGAIETNKLDRSLVSAFNAWKSESFFNAWKVGCWTAILFVILSLNEFQMAWRNVRNKLEAFPEMIRPYFSRFIYAELSAQTASEMASVVAVFVFMRAWKEQLCTVEQDNFERSSDLTRLGWFLNAMGPFLPFLVVPLSFFFRTDYFQRDVCASVIGLLMHDPLSSIVFAQAASQCSESELAAALSNPLQKPPRFGEPGFDESAAAEWCWRFYSEPDWQPRLFSEEWMGSSLNDVGDGHSIEIPSVHGGVYPGVIPKALEMMAALFGKGYMLKKGFCDNEQDTALSKDNLATVGDSNPDPVGPSGKAASLSERSSGWLNDWGAAFIFREEDEPEIASLRRKLIQAYSNITQQERRAAKASAHSRKTAKQGFSLAESEEFVWPMPGKQSSQLLRSETPRAKQRRRKAALAVASDGEFLGLPPQAEELLELGMPDLGSVAGGLGRQAICTFKSLMIAAMKMCAFCYILVTTAVSMYCVLQHEVQTEVLQEVRGLIIGVVDGLAAGVANVKAVLNRSCLPGYLQSITVFVTLPGILFVLVFFSQVGGSPLLSGAMCCLAVWRALDFKAGEVAIDIKSRKKLAKAIERIRTQKKICLAGALGFFIAHTLWMMYATRMAVKVDTSGAKDAIAICKLVYVRVFTKVVTTNWILEAVFDAADDHLKVKILAARSLAKEQGSAVEESWAKLTQNKRKKKKKKKKDEFTTDEEGGYYDSEGWYYPPPGEEGLGEVPDMPPAVEVGSGLLEPKRACRVARKVHPRPILEPHLPQQLSLPRRRTPHRPRHRRAKTTATEDHDHIKWKEDQRLRCADQKRVNGFQGGMQGLGSDRSKMGQMQLQRFTGFPVVQASHDVEGEVTVEGGSSQVAAASGEEGEVSVEGGRPPAARPDDGEVHVEQASRPGTETHAWAAGRAAQAKPKSSLQILSPTS